MSSSRDDFCSLAIEFPPVSTPHYARRPGVARGPSSYVPRRKTSDQGSSTRQLHYGPLLSPGTPLPQQRRKTSMPTELLLTDAMEGGWSKEFRGKEETKIQCNESGRVA